MLERIWFSLTQLLADPIHVLVVIVTWIDVGVIVLVILAVTFHALRSLKRWLFDRDESPDPGEMGN